MATPTAPDDALPQAARAYRDGQIYEAEVLYRQLLGNLPQDSHLFLDGACRKPCRKSRAWIFHEEHKPAGQTRCNALRTVICADNVTFQRLTRDSVADACRSGASVWGLEGREREPEYL